MPTKNIITLKLTTYFTFFVACLILQINLTKATSPPSPYLIIECNINSSFLEANIRSNELNPRVEKLNNIYVVSLKNNEFWNYFLIITNKSGLKYLPTTYTDLGLIYFGWSIRHILETTEYYNLSKYQPLFFPYEFNDTLFQFLDNTCEEEIKPIIADLKNYISCNFIPSSISSRKELKDENIEVRRVADWLIVCSVFKRPGIWSSFMVLLFTVLSFLIFSTVCSFLYKYKRRFRK